MGSFLAQWRSGSTPLHKAAKEGNSSAFNVAMQKHMSEIDVQERELGYTALHIAAWYGYDYIARELLTRGANPNLTDHDGRTPLHLAAKKGHVKVVEALLRANASKDAVDNLHHKPMDYATKMKNEQIIALLSPQPRRSEPAGPAPGGSSANQQPPPNQNQQRPTPAPLDHRLFDAPQGGVYPSLPTGNASNNSTPRPGIYPSVSPTGYGEHASRPQTPPQPTSPYYPPPATQYQGHTRQQDPGYGYDYSNGQAGYAMEAPSAPPPAADQPNVGGYYGLQPMSSGPGATKEVPPEVKSHHLEDIKTNNDQLPFNPGHAGLAGFKNAAQTAAELAMQQLAKLGLHKPPEPQTAGGAAGDPVNRPPSLPGWVGGLAGAAAAALANANKKMTKPQEKALQQQQQLAQQQENAAVAQALSPTSASGSAAEPFSGPPGRQYSYNAIAAATEYFAAANKIGEGGFGAVYRGVLDGIPVAVKVMDGGPNAMQGQKEFAVEVNILTRLHHPHVVLLIGSCPDKGLLVYELMEGGSLEERLFRSRAQVEPLPWQDRVRIAAEIASALLYLHSAPQPIVHMDLKPANVLLDRTLRAKLGDVGLARLMGHPSAVPAGTAGTASTPSTVQDSQLVGTLAYVDPEYLRTGHFSTKSDVYALGMVMLQMLTGLEQSNVVKVVEDARSNELNFAYVLDKRAGAWPAPEAMAFADIALKCCEFRRGERPDLREVVLPALMQLRQRTGLYEAPPGQGRPAPLAGASSADFSGQQAASNVPPAMFMCPITQDVMRDPVVAADGYTYEREAIQAWLSKASTSPLTNLPLQHTNVVPNMLVRSAIREWAQVHQAVSANA